jgi:hypothetical protein
MAGSSKGRARRLTEKAAALVEEQDNRGHHKRKSKPSTKVNRTSNKKRAAESETLSSDSSDASEEQPRVRKRRRPDPEEIEVNHGSSDLEPEIVEEGDDDEIVSDKEVDGGAGEDTGEDDDVQLIDPPAKVSQMSPNGKKCTHQFPE